MVLSMRFALLSITLLCAAPAAAQDAAADASAYLERIATIDDAGPQLNAVIVTNPDAPQEAAAAQSAGAPLAGRTVLVKDNIETREFPTTAGSLALADNMTGRDAPLIANLRNAGGVVLGKTNLSEWANIRSNGSTSGWSAVGGLTRNPYAIDRNSCGSSSGSGAAVAAGFAWAAIGTETNGSITCPASINGIVGFKPSVGLVSRTHVVPISSTQDTAGPMTQTVFDAALLLGAIAGEDPADAYRTVNAELEAYGEGLEDKPQLVALNKLDLADAELGEAFAEELLAAGADKVFSISGATGEGIEELLDAVLSYLPERTSTETKAAEVENTEEDGGGEWSPI